MGGGAHHRFGQSQAKLEDLWMVGISHLHPDHVSDLPAFLWQKQIRRRVPSRGDNIDCAGKTAWKYAKFVKFAKGANVLIMHLAIAPGIETPLHATPAVVGRIAQEAGVGQLIVSHIGLFNLDAAIADLRKFYTGPLTVGADMQCTPVQ